MTDYNVTILVSLIVWVYDSMTSLSMLAVLVVDAYNDDVTTLVSYRVWMSDRLQYDIFNPMQGVIV